MSGKQVMKQLTLIRNSGLFDENWYLRRYPDVAALDIDPARHFLDVGALLGRDPGPGFSTRYYLKANPDIAAEAVNPLLHYLERGCSEGRASLPVPHSTSGTDFAPRVDIVIPVHNALADVRACLASVRGRCDGCHVRVIVVNDGSDARTTAWLDAFCRESSLELIHNARNLGYTRSVNVGLRVSTAPYVVTLNSDTIVTRGWLRGLLRCIHSAPGIGIVGPLSNAASWQNVPELRDESGGFAVNALAPGMTADTMAALVARVSRRAYPRTPFVNGFCFMIARPVIEAIGLMDEDSFPLGYGEENDYCIRAADAGFELAIADDTYVFHAKSRSFGHERRKQLSREGDEAIRRKHSRFGALVAQVRQAKEMDRIRDRVRAALAQGSGGIGFDPTRMSVLFLLPVSGGGGGAHSVVQEAMAMRRLGVDATVAVRPNRLAKFRALYPDWAQVEGLFVALDDSNLLPLAADYDVVVGTIFWSMEMVARVCRAFPHILPAYYVQDYEPFFVSEGSPEHASALASYGLLPNAVLFAKTHWIIAKVVAEHGVAVHKVEPSIDHAVYYPVPRRTDGPIRVVAMIRPQTPWRGAGRTMRVLARLAQRRPGALAFDLFGCAPDSDQFHALDTGFDFEAHGILRRDEVAALLARGDVFVDLSDYQAFGRTAIEAMACGCVAVVPVHGGADEYASENNALVVDPFDEDACVDALDRLVGDADRMKRLRAAGLVAASKYSVHAAAVSELAVMGAALARHRGVEPRPSLPRLLLLPGRKPGGGIDWRSHARMVFPYRSRAVLQAWQVEIGSTRLPIPDRHAAVVIDPAAPVSLDALREWLPVWRGGGGLMICDLHQPPALPDPLAALDDTARWLAAHADLVTVSCPRLGDALGATAREVRVLPDLLDKALWGLDGEIDHGVARAARDPAKVRLGCCAVSGDEARLDMFARLLERLPLRFRNLIEVEVLAAPGVLVPEACKHVKIPHKRDYPGLVPWLRRNIHWDVGVLLPAARVAAQAVRPLGFVELAALDTAIACVGSDPGVHAGIARHGVTALVVADTCRGWFAAIRQLVGDPALRARLARAARAEVAAAHALGDVTELHADVLCRAGQAAAASRTDHCQPNSRPDRIQRTLP